MANLLATLFRKKDSAAPAKPRNLLKRVGIFSGILWVTAMGVGYAVKEIDLTPAGTHGKTAETAEAEEESTALAGVPSVPESHTDEELQEKDPAHGSGEAPSSDSPPPTHSATPAHPSPTAHASTPTQKAAPSHHPGESKPHATAPAAEQAEADEKPVTPPASQDERDALRQLAEIHVSRGNLEKAVHPLRKLLTEPTQDPALLSMAAQAFQGTGNYREALHAARKALRHSVPGRVDLEVTAILARYRLGEVAEAIKDARQALQKHPKDLDLLTTLGTMEIEMGPDQAGHGETLDQALRINPRHVPALYQKGRKAQLAGDYKDAETWFRKVIKLDPKHAKAHGQLGTALYHLRKVAPARKEFETAVELNPKDYNTWYNLGEARLALASQETRPARIRTLRTEALAAYLKAVEWNRDHAEAHFRIGVILNGNAQYKEAIRHLEASHRADGSHVPSLIQLAVAFEGLRKNDQAKAYLEKALELDPTDKIAILKLRLLSRFQPEAGA